MIEMILGVILGAICSWLIAYLYYKNSSYDFEHLKYLLLVTEKLISKSINLEENEELKIKLEAFEETLSKLNKVSISDPKLQHALFLKMIEEAKGSIEVISIVG